MIQTVIHETPGLFARGCSRNLSGWIHEEQIHLLKRFFCFALTDESNLFIMEV